METFLKKTLPGLALLCSASLSVAAPTHQLYVSGGGAWQVFDSGRKMDNTATPLLGLGYNFTKRWGAEATLGWINTDRNDANRKVTGYLGLLQLIHYWPLPEFVKNFKGMDWTKVEALTFTGVGMSRMNPNGMIGPNNPTGDEALEQANLNGGIAFQYYYKPNLTLRMDIRDIYTLANDRTDWLIGASVVYYLDKPEAESHYVK